MKPWYERVVAAHLSVNESVSHGTRLKSERYFVWQEDGSDGLAANNGHTERAVTGSTDLYTKVEFDPWAEALGKELTREYIAWNLVGVELEADTGFWHYSWDWTVLV